MKIAIIIPSYNEADNIAFVTRTIDKGLVLAFKKFPEISEAVIVNVDNCSPDKTSEVFLKTKTNFLKLSIRTKGIRGKGKNLIYFLKRFYKKYDIFITLDADLKSIKIDWVTKFLEPFFNKNKKCDFVWPLYKRSRFEGSTTNNFAYPIIYTFFNLDIRQPIAGDFAFNKKIANKIIKNYIPKESFYYGIDILFSIRAAQFATYAQQINLGYKIHKPSFPKLENMFPQVVAAAISTIKNKNNTLNLVKIINKNNVVCISENKKFVNRDKANDLVIKEINFLLVNLKKIPWLKIDAKDKINKIILEKDCNLSANLWSIILSNWLHYVLKEDERYILKRSKELLPFFVLRTVCFWNEASSLSGIEVEKKIKNQARMIKNFFNK